jgi:hypothetical protein
LPAGYSRRVGAVRVDEDEEIAEETMAKGQQRSTKEKKKPKAEWNKKKKGGPAQTAYASQYGIGQSKPEQSPFGKKG